MESFGILVPAKMCNEGKVVGSKVYGLSSGSLQFIREFRGSRKVFLSKELEHRYNTDPRLGSNLDYSMILNLLSLNQMHLHVMKAFGREYDVYGRIWVSPEQPVNLYCREQENLIVWSLRGGPGAYKRFAEQVGALWTFMLKSGFEPENTRLVVVVEDLRYPLELHPILSVENRQNLFYTTDQEVFEGNAMSRIIEVVGPKNYRFTE